MANESQPEFPVTVCFHETNEKWILDTVEELGWSLEWFDGKIRARTRR